MSDSDITVSNAQLLRSKGGIYKVQIECMSVTSDWLRANLSTELLVCWVPVAPQGIEYIFVD